MTDALIILAPHRSFTSVVCGMVGQHPQLYGLPEMNLFVSETFYDWWLAFRRGREIGAHGPLRTVAELRFGGQSWRAVEGARRWLRRRLQQTTASVFREIAQEAHPRIVVDKSPPTSYRIEYLQRALRTFPRARFLHLARHPRGHGESVVKALEEAGQYGALPRGVRELVEGRGKGKAAPGPAEQAVRGGGLLVDPDSDPPVIDPQFGWYRHNQNICRFLRSLPRERWHRVRGEDLLAQPEEHLRGIAAWLGVRTDDAAIDEMRHPERSPFACFGPPNAHLGNDPNFLREPGLDARPPKVHSLDGPLSWRPDGKEFIPEVRALAAELGYA